TKSDNDGEDFVYPKFSTHDKEERQEEEDKEEEGSDLRVQIPSHFETTHDETYDEVTKGGNVEGEKLDDEETNEEEISSVSSGFISNMLNPNPDTGIDSILNLNTKSTSLVDVPVTSNVEMPPSSVTTLPPPHTPLFEDRVKALEDDFSEFKQTNLFAEAVSLIPGIVDTYLANKINEAVKIVVQL
ncbi:hypothetical protein Tco_0048771, partial [Tanacetum coccineum]